MTTSSNRRTNDFLQDREVVPYSHVAESATVTIQIYKAPPGRAFKVDRVLYVNPTGLAQDPTNYFVIGAFNPATGNNAASWSTLTGAQGSLPANTIEALVLSASAPDLVIPPGGVLDLVCTLHGTQTLPPGAVRVEGRLL
jgi:hypothetical protein